MNDLNNKNIIVTIGASNGISNAGVDAQQIHTTEKPK